MILIFFKKDKRKWLDEKKKQYHRHKNLEYIITKLNNINIHLK